MKFYTLSPQGVPENQILFPMLRPVFESKEHSFVDNIENAEIVLFDLHSRQFDYGQRDIDWVTQNRPFVTTFDEWDRGGMSLEFWPNPLTKQMESILLNYFSDNIRSVHFCRLLDKTKKYYPNLYPYEKPILYEELMLTPEQLFERSYDICMICNESPARWSIAKAIEQDKRFNSIIRIAEPKIPFDNWVNAHRQAKFFVSASGGGYGNERPQNLFSISCHLQEETDQLLLHPFVHGETCLKISTNPTKSELDIIFEYCTDKEKLYTLYKNNYDFIKKYYSAEAISSDILEKILKHCANAM